MKSVRLFILFVLVPLLVSAQKRTNITALCDSLYKSYEVTGSFILYDLKKNRYTFYNKAQATESFLPASTFKICNALIGLETGVIKDEFFMIRWDSVVRNNPAWNRAQDLQTAFRNSTVWYFQELARRVGYDRMKYWVTLARYGNMDISGGIDRFWLDGGLRITPQQQIDFLVRLYKNKLPFSQRSMDIVKKIMVAESTRDHTLRAKTGWAIRVEPETGWYVGWVETKSGVWFFATCLQNSDPENIAFTRARIDITMAILKKMNIIPR